MKLKNKRSGEIKEFVLFDGKNELQGGATLKDLVKEWEDAPEEPKEWYWFIEDEGVIQRSCHYEDLHPTLDKARKEIGNYFETQEEAELAVRKLQAWKRLKDKGFRFVLSATTMDRIDIIRECFYSIEQAAEAKDDIIILFGGEE